MTGRSSDSIMVPAGYEVRLSLRPPACFVVAAPEGMTPTPEAAMERGHVALLLTHDPDVAWPDWDGVAQANAFLAKRWAVLFQFASVGDALACRARLALERVQ